MEELLMPQGKNKVNIHKRKALKKSYMKARKARLLNEYIGERVIMAGKTGLFEENYKDNTYEINITRYSLDSIIYEINGIKEALSQATRIEFRKLIELNTGKTPTICQ